MSPSEIDAALARLRGGRRRGRGSVTEDTLDAEIAFLLAAEHTIRDLAAIIAEHKPPFKEAEATT
jgi:hypothetical protein